MSKSTLVRVLRRAYRIIQVSKKSGVPSDEVTEMLTAQRSFLTPRSRRRILQGGLFLAGAAIATGVGPRSNRAIAQDSSLSPILIVGAGLAGLTAAYRLQQAGVPVDVVEARNTVGGRIRTARNVLSTSRSAELGGEKINSDHTYIQGLTTELGFQLADLHEATAGLTEDTFYFGGHQVPLPQLIQDFASIAEQIEADLEAIANFESYDVVDPPTIELDQLSISAYLDRIPSNPMIRDIIKLAYTTEYGLDADEQSCLNLLWYIGTEPGTFSIYGASDERYHIKGGNDQVPQKLAEMLTSSIATGTILESLRERSDGHYQVTLRANEAVTERIYDRVVLALPFSALRDVSMMMDLPAAKQLAIASLSYGTNTKLITAYGDRSWANRYSATASAFSDTGFQNSWESSEGIYTSSSASLVTNYTGGDRGLEIENTPVQDSAQSFVSQFDQIFPGVAEAHYQGRAARSSWNGDRFSQGSYSCYKVGDWTRFYNAPAERVRNLFFIGEHCSWEYAGYMEGACETGELAALEILEELGISEAAQHQRHRVSANQLARLRQPHPKPFRQAVLNQHRLDIAAQELRSTALSG